MQNGLHIEVIKDLTSLGRVEHVTSLVDAEFRKDHRQFFFQHLTYTVLHRVLQHEVDGPDSMVLPNAVHTSDPLFQPHRVPGDVVVDHDVAELQI